MYFLAHRYWGYKNKFEVDEEDDLYIWMLHKYHRVENEPPDKKEEEEHRQTYNDPTYQENQEKLKRLE